MHINKITNHYFKLLRNLKEGKISVEQLNDSVERDVQGFKSMLNKNLINKPEFDSMLIVINEFEDMFEEIINQKETKWTSKN